MSPRCSSGLCLVALATIAVQAAHFSAVDRPMPAPSQAVWSNGLARVGAVLVDPSNHCVLVQGYINQTGGLIELLACGPEGKRHESLLVLEANPLDLNIGLLLLGLKAVSRPSEVGAWPDPQGPGLDLWVEWQQNGKAQRCRAEELVFNEKTGRALPATPWIYTGSVIEHGYFRALSEDSHIATYWDPWALINLPLPCGADDHILSANEKAVPPAGTPVRLVLQVHQPSWWERFGQRFRGN
jgi:hypothetical protein